MRLLHQLLTLSALSATLLLLPLSLKSAESSWKLATFSADITIPLGHRCMGVLPTKSQKIADPLYVHGFVLLGTELAIYLVEVRVGAVDIPPFRQLCGQ